MADPKPSVLPDGETTYNVQLVNGRWYIVRSSVPDEVFQEIRKRRGVDALPRGMAFPLPEDMAPTRRYEYNDKQYGLVAPTAIQNYFESDEFVSEYLDKIPRNRAFETVASFFRRWTAAQEENERRSAAYRAQQAAEKEQRRKDYREAQAEKIKILDADGNTVSTVAESRGQGNVPGAPRSTVVPGQVTSPRAAEGRGAQPEADPWFFVRRVSAKAQGTEWDAQNEFFFSAPGQQSYILTVDGRATVVPVGSYRQKLATMTREERRQNQLFMKKFWGLGYNGPTDGSLDPNNAFQKAMEDYADFSTKQNYYRFVAAQSGTPGDFNPLDDTKLLAQSASAGGVGYTQTTIRYEDFTDAEARGILEDYYQDAIGRRPTKKEAQKFAELLRRKAAEKPTRTVQTRTETTDVIRSTGGFSEVDARLMAREQAEARPESQAYRMETAVFDSFLEALNKPFG